MRSSDEASTRSWSTRAMRATSWSDRHTACNQVFKPQFFQNAAIDRTMFALTVKNGQTRIYLTDGTANAGGTAGALAANFWRLDNANQPAATLLASQGTCVAPNPATHTF